MAVVLSRFMGEIVFGPIPVTITGRGEYPYCMAKINESTYTESATGIEVMPGDIITLSVTTNSYINIDGVSAGFFILGGSYDWTVPKRIKAINIDFSHTNSNNGYRVNVTTTKR